LRPLTTSPSPFSYLLALQVVGAINFSPSSPPTGPPNRKDLLRLCLFLDTLALAPGGQRFFPGLPPKQSGFSACVGNLRKLPATSRVCAEPAVIMVGSPLPPRPWWDRPSRRNASRLWLLPLRIRFLHRVFHGPVLAPCSPQFGDYPLCIFMKEGFPLEPPPAMGDILIPFISVSAQRLNLSSSGPVVLSVVLSPAAFPDPGANLKPPRKLPSNDLEGALFAGGGKLQTLVCRRPFVR